MNTTQNAQTQWLDTSLIDVPDHFREHSPEAQESLVKDIQEHGLLQEIVVAAKPEGRYELVAGKGRLTAVQKLGWQQIRAQVLTGVSELDKALIGIAENEEREDVSPIGKARSYKRAMDAGSLSQRDLANRLGLPESTISASMALLELSAETQRNFERSKFSMGHLTQFIRVKDEGQLANLAEECEKKQWTVKELQSKVNKLLAPAGTTAEEPKAEAGFQFHWKGQELVVRGRLAAAGKGRVTLSEEFGKALYQFLDAHPQHEEVAQAA